MINHQNRPQLTIESLKKEAAAYCPSVSQHKIRNLYGVTDGKAIGTYLEQQFKTRLHEKYIFEEGSSAKGRDFPELNVDMKVTSINQPQSSAPFKSARQKIYGLNYSLLIFVYQKTDDSESSTSHLSMHHAIFMDKTRTADTQTTRGILEIINRDGNAEDLVAFMNDRHLPVDELSAIQLAEEILRNPPKLGYLTISNALQWRLQYTRALESADGVDGITKVW